MTQSGHYKIVWEQGASPAVVANRCSRKADNGRKAAVVNDVVRSCG